MSQCVIVLQVVPSKLPSPPPALARVRWSRYSPAPGDTMITGNMRDRPQVTWSSGDSGLFTIMILDEGISFLNGQQYAHWLVTNVPGSGNALEGIFINKAWCPPPFSSPFFSSPLIISCCLLKINC